MSISRPLLRLGKNEAHLWLARIERCCTAVNLERYLALLSDDERDRLQRLRFAPLKHEYLLTRALCRHALSRYVDVDPAAWRFGANAFGRRHVTEPLSLRAPNFNLSNARTMVACVVAWDRDVGVDVERLEHREDLLELAASHFASSECDGLRALPAQDQSRRFLDLWTLKESYIKARGQGLSIPLDRFAFDLDTTPQRFRCDPHLEDDASAWRFWTAAVENHVVAVAAHLGNDFDISLRTFEAIPLESEEILGATFGALGSPGTR